MADMGALLNQHFTKRTVRGPIHPLDKATIVSIYPKMVNHKNPTTIPGEWTIPSGTLDNPTILIVGPSSWWKNVGNDQPLMEVTHNAMEMAESIIKDYSSGLIQASLTSMPGLFFVPGCKYDSNNEPSELLTKAWILKEYKHLIEAASEKQTRWFDALIEEGNTLWARTNGNPRSIGDDMRLAARLRNKGNVPWMGSYNPVELRPCIACGNLVNFNYPVCQHCGHVINAELYKKLGLTKAS